MMLNPNATPEVLTTVEKDGNTLDVIVQQEQAEQPKSIDDMLATEVPTAIGTTMPFLSLSQLEEGTTLNTLARSAGEYYATVSGTVT